MDTPDTPAFLSDTLWSTVEDGFHVCSQAGTFLGYIDRQTDGSYLAFDGQSSRIGVYLDRAQAMVAVTESRPT